MDCCLTWPGTTEGPTNGIPEPAESRVPTPGAGWCLGLCVKATALRRLLTQLPLAGGAPLPWSLKQLERDRFLLLNNLRQQASGPGMEILGGDEGNLSDWDDSPWPGLGLTFSSLLRAVPSPCPKEPSAMVDYPSF